VLNFWQEDAALLVVSADCFWVRVGSLVEGELVKHARVDIITSSIVLTKVREAGIAFTLAVGGQVGVADTGITREIVGAHFATIRAL
jgi:hypothetical protein